MLFPAFFQSLVFHKVTSFNKVRFLFSCCFEACFFLLFIVVSVCLVDFEGLCLTTYLLTGLLYLVTVGRKAIFSSAAFFSFPSIPCFIPAFFFLIVLFSSLRSDTLTFIIALIWIGCSKWPLLQKEQSFDQEISYRSIINKLFFFLMLQSIYSITIGLFYQSLIEPLEWQLSSEDLKPKNRYLSQTGIQFFYDNQIEADKIEIYLPEVIQTLKNSQFYLSSESIVLVQKDHCNHLDKMQEAIVSTRGFYYPPKQYSYYITSGNQDYPLDKIYYAHNNPYRSAVLHELTHQLVSRYYGKWRTKIFIETWKNEGYAEYMVAIGSYFKKEELWAILIENNLSDAIIENPFKGQKFFPSGNFEDYAAAFLQTRYALDVKKIPLLDFFKHSYKPASAKEIKDWLMKRD